MADFTRQAHEMGYRINPVDNAVALSLDVSELSYRIAELLPLGPFDSNGQLQLSRTSRPPRRGNRLVN